ncbi:MAG: hypothetical protein JWL71_4418 [Acidobacteria bacterium]|nr:hypothetical protein [Acidobacteriota bacterium]
MRAHIIARAAAFVLIVAGTSILAAPEQTAQPGQMTQPRVWIQNHGRAEAVPISIQEAALDTPLRVRVVNLQDPKGTDGPIQARLVQQSWDYRTIVVTNGQDPAAALTAPGAAGWEATGVTFVRPDGMTLLLKRPRLP